MSIHLIHSLRSRGETTASLAKHLDVHRQCVYDALKGRGVRRIRVYIAFVIGVPPSSIFPKLSKNSKILDDSDYFSLKGSQDLLVFS